MFDNLISSDRKKKYKSWSPLSLIGSLIIVALVIVGAVYASTGQQKKNQKKKKKLVTYMKVFKPPKPKKPAPKPPKPKTPPPPKPKVKKPAPKGFQTLHPPKTIANKIPPVNLNAKAVNAKDFSGLGAAGGRANGHGSGNGKKTGGGGSGKGGLHTIFEAVGQMPKLKGGYPALEKHVKYPASCRNAGIEGRVTVQFVVNTKGVPTHVHVTRGIGGGCDRAAVEAVKQYARFTPGRQRGTAVMVRMSLPIVFRLKY